MSQTAAQTEDAAAIASENANQSQDAEAERSAADAADAINALRLLPPRLFARVCRRIPLRAFLPELEKLDRPVFFRYFKGLRPQKIDGPYLEKVFRKEIFEKNDGLLAQLVIFNYDEAEHRLYADLQTEVKKINEDVEAIETISDEQGNAICDALQATFDERDIYIAFAINGVRVAADFYAKRFPQLSAAA